MSVMIGGQSGNQSRLGTGLAASGPEFQADVVQALIPISAARVAGNFRKSIIGVTQDGTGAALGACTVHVFGTVDDKLRDVQPSDASGNYVLSVYDDGPFYCVAYKAGSPDVAGTTVNTLVGV